MWLIAALALGSACDAVDESLLMGRGEDGVMAGPRDASAPPQPKADCALDFDPDAAELCNDLDDDCDGEVDEGAAASCELDRAVAACLPGGQCAVAECEDGFIDCNGEAADGCEIADADAPCGCNQTCPSSVDAGVGPGTGDGEVDGDEVDGDESSPQDAGVPDPVDAGEPPPPECEPSEEGCSGDDEDCDGEVDEGGVCELQACIDGAYTRRGPDCDACACASCRPEMDRCQLSGDANTATLCQDLVTCYAEHPCVDCYSSGDCTAEVHLASGATDPMDSSLASANCAVEAEFPCAHATVYRACLDQFCAAECPQ
ncbi:MAG: hypothetical protein OXT09_34790 [Myxococcales bacterium]|nr:hypothetical protein [Myxococcales bacterium]